MNLIKTISLAALAAIVASAIAASSAAADASNIVICAKAELECENPLVTEVLKLENEEKHEIAQIHGTAEDPKLLATGLTVECKESLANITVENELSESLLGHVTELTFEKECENDKGAECEVKAETLGDVTFTKIGALAAKAESDGGTTVNVKCGFAINCTFGGKPQLTAHSDAEGNTHLLAEKAKLEEGKGFLCPKEAFWDADYPAVATMWIES